MTIVKGKKLHTALVAAFLLTAGTSFLGTAVYSASTATAPVAETQIIYTLSAEPPLQAKTKESISLTFNPSHYETVKTTVNNKTVIYRAYTAIPYVSNPVDRNQQSMNIYIPEEYFYGGFVNGYNAQTAPIFMPNGVGGYMPGNPVTPTTDRKGEANSSLYALSRGYVVATPATRGRTNQDAGGNYIGKAPAVIVDLQAATAYLHANDAIMPGNAERIITNGTSAGGAVSLLQGATGNSSDFLPYLEAIGAASASTTVYAASAYCPITNLDHADLAYEWNYNSITSFDKVSMGRGALPQANMGQGALQQATIGDNTAPPKLEMQHITLSEEDKAYSSHLKEQFSDYVNSLNLRDRNGTILKLDKNGNGSFKEYVKSFIITAANTAVATGTDMSTHTYLLRDAKTGTIKDIDWDAYNQFVSRSKVPGAFDSRANDSGENNLFGTKSTDNNHFTMIAAINDTTTNQYVPVANEKIVKMMNPMNYLGASDATNATYYRIRYGTSDSNTSIAIPLIVGLRAENLGYQVDMETPFNVGHSGDYDLKDLFDWMDSIVRKK